MAGKLKPRYYNNNENLPINEEYEWTTDLINEFKKCKDDVIYFAENFFYIVTADEGKKKITLHDVQKDAINAIIDNRYSVICASRQIGKCLGLDTPIPVPTGWTTMGQLKDGDALFDNNGNICKVIKAHDILYNNECYEISFDTGEKIIADKDHRWFTQSNREISGSIKTTYDIFKSLKISKHKISTSKNGINMSPKIYELHPYLLGLRLSNHINNDDIKEISSYIINNKILNVDELSNYLHDNLYDTFNPENITDYLRGSTEQRLELLRGLMDASNGSTNGKVCYFYNTNIEMIKYIQELLSSLSIKYITNDNRDGKTGEQIYCIMFNTNERVFNLKRKADKQHTIKNKNQQDIYIKDIRKIESVPVRCITVDSPDEMFLCGKTFIPTKNTTLMTIVCLWMTMFRKDFKIAILANKEDMAIEILDRIKMAYEEMPNWLKSGIEKFSELQVRFINGSRIFVSTTSANAIRGKTVNLVFLDEFAFVPRELADMFFKSVLPTISSGKTTKIVITSCVTDDTFINTPNGIKQVKDYVLKEKNGIYEIDDYTIEGRNHTNAGSLMFNNGEADTYEISTDSTSLKSSNTHKLFACRNGEYGWHTVEQLAVGDWISIKYGLEKWGDTEEINFTEVLLNNTNLDEPVIIPDKVMEMSRDNIILILQGIFDRPECSISNKGIIKLVASHKISILQIRALLMNFGILSSYKESVILSFENVDNHHMEYRLELSQYNSKLFFEKIGFGNNEKQIKYDVVKHITGEKLDEIPVIFPYFNDQFKKIRKKFTPNGLKYSFYGKKKKGKREDMLLIKKQYGLENSLLNEIVDEQIKWEPIKDKQYIGKQQVYDFSLNDVNYDDEYDWAHSVLYNGMIGHQTPNGASGKFYEIFSEAEKGTNGWAFRKIYWHQIPGRDLAWKEEVLKMINYDINLWNQEYDIHFLENGISTINADLLARLSAKTKKPLLVFDDGDYKIWEEYQDGHIYVFGVDVSSGVGQDYTVCQILDITDLTNIVQVAQYNSNTIQPFVFAEKLNQIARAWGRPFLCVESNKEGNQVLDAIMNIHNYDNIVYYNMENDKRGYYQKPGIYCHSDSKFVGISNMKYWVEHMEALTIYDLATLKEFETFVRKPNKTWSATAGAKDDKIMALIWALVILETKIAERYFNIIESDDIGKPLRIEDPNADLASDAFKNANKNISYAKSGGQPMPVFFTKGSYMSNHKDLEMSNMFGSGFRIV